MNAAAAAPRRPAEPAAPTLAMLASVVLVAVLARWLAYTGFFGSDEVTYIDSAFKLLDGNWVLDDYVGANRLGVNLPMAAFAAIFGRNEFGAALFSLACSVAEVALVAWAGARWFGPRVGWCAGLLLATLPVHVHFGGRIMADAPLALLISASFVLFAEGERRGWSAGYFWSGVCAGASFLVKPVTLFVFAILLLYPLVARRLDRRWLWAAAGFLLAMLANGWLYESVTGRFWYVFEVVRERRASGYLEAGASAGEIRSMPLYYFEFLFVRIYHTGLVGFAAVAGAALLFRDRLAPMARWSLFWAGGLLLILSFLPVSARPLLLVPKQTNYMLMFAAPLCLLAGVALARVPNRGAVPLLTLMAGLGVALALLLQASVAVFVANSKPTLELAQAQPPKATLYVMANTLRAAEFQALTGGPDLQPRLGSMKDLAKSSRDHDRLAVIDTESFGWDITRPFASPGAVPACWVPLQRLQGRPEGPGAALVRAVEPLARRVPALARLLEPRPAQVYRVPKGC